MGPSGHWLPPGLPCLGIVSGESGPLEYRLLFFRLLGLLECDCFLSFLWRFFSRRLSSLDFLYSGDELRLWFRIADRNSCMGEGGRVGAAGLPLRLGLLCLLYLPGDGGRLWGGDLSRCLDLGGEGLEFLARPIIRTLVNLILSFCKNRNYDWEYYLEWDSTGDLCLGGSIGDLLRGISGERCLAAGASGGGDLGREAGGSVVSKFFFAAGGGELTSPSLRLTESSLWISPASGPERSCELTSEYSTRGPLLASTSPLDWRLRRWIRFFLCFPRRGLDSPRLVTLPFLFSSLLLGMI